MRQELLRDVAGFRIQIDHCPGSPEQAQDVWFFSGPPNRECKGGKMPLESCVTWTTKEGRPHHRKHLVPNDQKDDLIALANGVCEALLSLWESRPVDSTTVGIWATFNNYSDKITLSQGTQANGVYVSTITKRQHRETVFWITEIGYDCDLRRS
jgi:hypothetical protein